LIGGNVFNTVMMRKMPLDRAGRVVLPTPQSDSTQDQNEDSLGIASECTPAHEELCDFNRRDWAALLKLRPDAAVAAPPPTAPLPTPDTAPAEQTMPPGFPRVVPPRPEAQPSPTQQPE
ncbi:DUF2272 domain-containing protein, partial [Xanthomonas citri]